MFCISNFPTIELLDDLGETVVPSMQAGGNTNTALQRRPYRARGSKRELAIKPGVASV